ncbi:hypothetical protein BG004_007424 [Podila humilis]|nr:hypothetical protein BG004_007424 [Podila humilis]
MNEVYTGGMSSYTVITMILSFLQMHPIIQQRLIDPMDNLGVLFVEFLELYGTCFHYAKVGLSIRHGGSYFDKVQNPVGPLNTHARPGQLLLCCEDPNDANNDIAKGSYQLSEIRTAFKKAFETLVRNMADRNKTIFCLSPAAAGTLKVAPKEEEVEAYTTPVPFDDNNRVPADSVAKSSGVHIHNATESSLLKDVLSISSRILEHREHVKTVFYQGEFQKMFGDPPGIMGLN